MGKVCVICGKELGKGKQKYCSYECERSATKARFQAYNSTLFRGKTTATTGAISELRVAIDLLAKGYDVFRALSPSCPCDLAILRDSKLLRVEVRTSFISISGKPYRTKKKGDDANNIDVYAWVLPDKVTYEPELE